MKKACRKCGKILTDADEGITSKRDPKKKSFVITQTKHVCYVKPKGK